MTKAEKFASWLISTIEKNEPETAAIIIQEELSEMGSNEIAALKAELEKWKRDKLYWQLEAIEKDKEIERLKGLFNELVKWEKGSWNYMAAKERIEQKYLKTDNNGNPPKDAV